MLVCHREVCRQERFCVKIVKNPESLMQVRNCAGLSEWSATVLVYRLVSFIGKSSAVIYCVHCGNRTAFAGLWGSNNVGGSEVGILVGKGI